MKFDLAAWGAELTPDRPAVWFNGRWYSYRDLNERATRLANRLAASGIGYGARVGLLAGNHLAHFDLMFAAPKLGFLFVPFDIFHVPSDLRAQAERIRLDLLVYDARFADVVGRGFDCPRATLDQYRSWLGHASREHLEAPVLSPESIQMILFTDGEDGVSHPALIPYRQVLSNARATAIGWELGPEDCAIQATPCFQASIHVLSIPLLAVGGRVVLMNAFEPGEYLRLMQRLEATAIHLHVDMYRRLVLDPSFAEADLQRVRWALCTGVSCPEGVARAMRDRGVPFKRGYGTTEAGFNAFAIGVEEAAAHPESTGHPLPHLDVRIRRPDGSECEAGEVGELTFAGRGLCAGYFDPGQAWPSVYRDGWFWSGDLAQRDAEGRHYLRGRRDERYVAAGTPVYPAQVEHAIEQCFGVAECMVIRIPDARGGDTGLAAVVIQPGMITGADVLRRELRGRLPAEAIPQVILFVDELPRTSQGSPDRVALRRMLESREA